MKLDISSRHLDEICSHFVLAIKVMHLWSVSPLIDVTPHCVHFLIKTQEDEEEYHILWIETTL